MLFEYLWQYFSARSRRWLGANERCKRRSDVNRPYLAVDPLVLDACTGKHDRNIRVVSPRRSMRGGDREAIEVIDEAVRLENHKDITRPTWIVTV